MSQEDERNADQDIWERFYRKLDQQLCRDFTDRVIRELPFAPEREPELTL